MEKIETTEDQEQANAEKKSRLLKLAAALLTKRDEAVVYRATSGVERRWKEDEATYDSWMSNQKTAMMDYATGTAPVKAGTGPVRSQVVVNILRSRCETAEGRFADIQLPVDERNFGLKVTPVPTLVKGMKDDRPVINTETNEQMPGPDGQPVKASDVARAKMEDRRSRLLSPSLTGA